MIIDLEKDPALRQQLQAARSWGVSPRRFLGWEPARFTHFEYGDAYLLISAITTHEPEWDDQDRDLAMALAAYEANLCPSCHESLAETTLPEREDAYVSKPAVRCHRCTASAQAAERYRDAPHPSALLLPIELRESIKDDD